MLAHDLAVSLDSSVARDGRPFTGGVDEGEVYRFVGSDIVGFAGFGVRVEKEVEAVGFLRMSLGLCLLAVQVVVRGSHILSRPMPCISTPADRYQLSVWSTCRTWSCR